MQSSQRNTRRIARTGIVVAAALLVLAGCGGDDDESSSDTTAAATATTDAPDETDEDTTTNATATTSTPKTDPPTETTAGDVDPWTRRAIDIGVNLGEQGTVECPADGTLYNVWGTGTYTNDSSICSAAVHAGLITVDDGGEVLVEVTEGEESYEASEANGVTTLAYGAWGGSFIFPDGQP